jgi:hypothetical protein
MRQEFSETVCQEQETSRAGETFEPRSAAGGEAQGNSQHSNIHIRGLPVHADEAMLVRLFAAFGQVQSARVFMSSVVSSWA